MKRTSAAAAAFAAILLFAGAVASAQPILYEFAGLPGGVTTCKWFDDNLNADRDIGSLTRQTDLLYNRIALPAGVNVAPGATATSAKGDELIEYALSGRTVCSTATALYGATPEPSASP